MFSDVTGQPIDKVEEEKKYELLVPTKLLQKV
jgi:hypothetical protein